MFLLCFAILSACTYFQDSPQKYYFLVEIAEIEYTTDYETDFFFEFQHFMKTKPPKQKHYNLSFKVKNVLRPQNEMGQENQAAAFVHYLEKSFQTTSGKGVVFGDELKFWDKQKNEKVKFDDLKEKDRKALFQKYDVLLTIDAFLFLEQHTFESIILVEKGELKAFLSAKKLELIY